MYKKHTALIFIIGKSSATKRNTADESRTQKCRLCTNYLSKHFLQLCIFMYVKKPILILFPQYRSHQSKGNALLPARYQRIDTWFDPKIEVRWLSNIDFSS
jgi:hypothetical protein